MTDPTNKRRANPWLLAAAAVVISSVVGVTVWQRLPAGYFARETENPAAIAALRGADLSAAPTVAEHDWPQWFGPGRDGRAPPGPLGTDWGANPPTPVWSVPLGGGYASFAVVAGRAYTQDKQGDSERVICLDAASGEKNWVYEYPVDYRGIGFGNGPRATPTVHDSRVYAVGAVGTFLCLEPPTRPGQPPQLLWRKDLLEEFDVTRPDFGVACSPLIEGDLVIVQPGGRKGTLAAFDRTTGQLRWATGSGPWSYSSPVAVTAAGVRQVIAATGDAILGVRADDGRELWKHPWKTEHQANIATPIVAGDYVFYSSGYNKGCVLLHLKPDGGGVLADQVYFRPRGMQNHFATSIFRDGFLYGFDGDRGMRCVDFRTGKEIKDWEARDEDNKALMKGCAILAGNNLIGLTTTGTLFLCDADPKEFVFRGKLDGVLSGGECWALPVLVNGRLYLRDAEKAVCLDTR